MSNNYNRLTGLSNDTEVKTLMMEGSDLDMSNFMDVVTTYKCKFCTFICSNAELIIKHIKESHIQSQPEKSASVTVGEQHGGDVTDSCNTNSQTKCKTKTLDDQSQREHCGDDDSKSCGDGKHRLVDNIVLSLEKQTVDVNVNSTVILCMDLSEVQDGCRESVVSGAESSIESGDKKTVESGCLLESELPVHPNASTSNSDYANVSADSHSTLVTNVVLPVPGLSYSSMKSVQCVTEEKSTFDTVAGSADKSVMVSTGQHQQQSSAIITIAPMHGTSSKDVITCLEPLLDANNCQTSVTQTSDSNTEREDCTATFDGRSDYGEESIIVRELFLCGICSQTFCSIEAVGDHMKISHPEAVPFLNEKTDGEKSTIKPGHEAAPKKKKVGRKKMSEMIELEEENKNDLEDEDWEPGQDLGVRHDGRKRRKTQPPHALKKDYYIEKDSKVTLSRKKRRNRYSIVDTHSLKCHVFGCQARFVFDQTLDYHLRCHDDSGCFTCPECHQEFKLWSVLKLHLWKEHNVDLDLFKCDQCEYRVDTVRKLTIHKEIHSENRPYTCDICGKGFKQFSQMKNHQVIHEVRDPNNPSSWYASKQCEICKRWYSNKKSLQKHIEAVHNKERPYLCPFCNHKAARKAMIQLHIRTHTGEKPFMCNVCQYSTGDHNSMRKHRMRHTGQRQYKCMYCSYTCIQAISLKSHLKTKHPGKEGIYSCGSCHFKTVNKIHFENHVADHQNGLVESMTTDKPKRTRLQRIPIIQMETVPKLEPVQVEMQVQTMDSGEAQISADDLAKLTNCTGLLSGEITAVQLIYSALSAISHNPQTDGTQTAQLPGGIETTIRSESVDAGVTTHTITFNVPTKIVSNETQAEQVIFTESIEVEEGGSIDDQMRLQIDLDAVTVSTTEDGSQVQCCNQEN